MKKNVSVEHNLALMTDSYKASHYLLWLKEMKRAYYYTSARIPGKFLKWFGYQMIMKKHYMEVPSHDQVDFANSIWTQHGLPFNKQGWHDIADLGYLPIEICAAPEGTILHGDVPARTMVNTIDDFVWLPGWLETLDMHVWYPSSVCTKDYMFRQSILHGLEKSGDPSLIDFKLHDFGYRGCTGQEAAELGGAAHLVNFKGTDTMAGILAAMAYYGAPVCGFSICATEHSPTTAWGPDRELEFYRHVIKQFAKEGVPFAAVCDTWSFDNALDNLWGKQLKQELLDSKATFVSRPDSGDGEEVTVRGLEFLEGNFGVTMNGKGFRVVDGVARLIQGDGIESPENTDSIMNAVMKAGFSVDNIAFGSGGGLLQRLNRDTFKFATKCSAVLENGEWNDVYKSPIDAPWKASKKGHVTTGVDKDGNQFSVRIEDLEKLSLTNLLRPVFRDGELLIDEKWEDIRSR